MKNTQFQCLSFVAEMFLVVILFLEVYSVLKTGCTPDRPPWLADKCLGFGPARTLTFSMISYSQIFLF